VDLFSLMMQERASTGRIYIQNVDHCNTHSPFDPSVAPVRQSNLCLEIALPTKPLEDVNDENGEIALCTLSAFNLGAIEKPGRAGRAGGSGGTRPGCPARLSGLPAQGRHERAA
jgi:ribonucleotide reductase alpha subunit